MSKDCFPSFILENSHFKWICDHLHPFDQHIFFMVLNQIQIELFPKYGYFSESDFQEICKKAASEYLEKISKTEVNGISSEEIHYLWNEVVSDFIKNYWGYQKKMDSGCSYRPQIYGYVTPSDLPKKKVSEISYRDTFFYIWVVIQSFIIMKALMLVYGNQLAKDDSFENRIIFSLVVLSAFGSLFLFAWLRRNKKYT